MWFIEFGRGFAIPLTPPPPQQSSDNLRSTNFEEFADVNLTVEDLIFRQNQAKYKGRIVVEYRQKPPLLKQKRFESDELTLEPRFDQLEPQIGPKGNLSSSRSRSEETESSSLEFIMNRPQNRSRYYDNDDRIQQQEHQVLLFSEKRDFLIFEKICVT